MAVAITLVKRHGVGGVTNAIFTLVLSGTYPAGGEPLAFAAAMGYTNREPDAAYISGTSGLTYTYDAVNDKLRAFSTYGGELAPGAYTGAMTGDTITAVALYVSTPKQ